MIHFNTLSNNNISHDELKDVSTSLLLKQNDIVEGDFIIDAREIYFVCQSRTSDRNVIMYREGQYTRKCVFNPYDRDDKFWCDYIIPDFRKQCFYFIKGGVVKMESFLNVDEFTELQNPAYFENMYTMPKHLKRMLSAR